MNNSNISTRLVLKEALDYTKKIYLQLLIFGIPSLIIELIAPIDFEYEKFISLTPDKLTLTFIDIFIISPFVDGASIYLVYESLRNNGIASVPNSFEAARDKFINLVITLMPVTIVSYILLYFMSNFSKYVKDPSNTIISILLIISVIIYLLFRLSFTPYAIMFENSSPSSAFKSSLSLTKGHFWVLFRASLWAFVLFLIPTILFSIPLSILLLGNENYDTISNIMSSLVTLIITPVLATYYVFLFFRLRNST